MDDIDKEVISELSTLEVSKMFAIVDERFPADAWNDKLLDIEKYSEKAERHHKLANQFIFGYCIVFLLVTLNFFSGGASIQLFSLRLENLGGITDFLLFVGSFLIATSYGFSIRADYYAAIVRTHVIRNEEVQKWQYKLEVLEKTDSPFFYLPSIAILGHG